MKTTLTSIAVLTLLLVLSPSAKAQDRGGTGSTVERLTLTFELGELPGHGTGKSRWEVSYQWRIADQKEFMQWSMQGEDPAKQDNVGVLLSKQSFMRRNLTNPSRRRFSTSVPVRGDLLERIQNAGQRQQIVWLDAVVRVHDDKLGREVIKRVNPAWGPTFYQHGNANLRMELTDDWKLQWYTSATAPWADNKKAVLRTVRTPSPK